MRSPPSGGDKHSPTDGCGRGLFVLCLDQEQIVPSLQSAGVTGAFKENIIVDAPNRTEPAKVRTLDFQPPANLKAEMQVLARTTGAYITIETDPLKAVAGADFLYTDVWVSMGEPEDVWKQRIHQLLPYQITTTLMQATKNSRTRFMHCLPAFHNLDTEIGRQIYEKYG